MNKNAYTILRVGLAITFLWIGLLILKHPEAWVGYIQHWAIDLLPIPAVQLMLGTAVFDLAIGFLLLIDYAMPLASILAALHLMIVLIVSGIDSVTVRDVGLLAAALALFMETEDHWVHKRAASKREK